jgi:hypothetical protein
MIELHIVGQLRHQHLPRAHLNWEGLAQLKLKCRRCRRGRGDVMELDPDLMDPPRRQAQQLLQGGERHDHQTLESSPVKCPGNHVRSFPIEPSDAGVNRSPTRLTPIVVASLSPSPRPWLPAVRWLPFSIWVWRIVTFCRIGIDAESCSAD